MTPGEQEDIVLKFLHTADWHLGRRFPAFKDEKTLTRARRDVLDRILGVAERNTVDVVLCAGDLFDDPAPSTEWWEPLAESFSKRTWRDRRVVLLPGNHDPLLPDSVWSVNHPFRRALPSWVHVVDKDLFELALPGDAVLYAVPCQSKAGQRDPTLSIPKREPGDERVRIGMVHGSTFDMEGWQTNFPIARDAVLDRGLDYLAIGDTHGFRFVPPDRKHPATIYPGAPEATAFDEIDPGNVAVVFVNRQRRATVRPERVARWTWEERTVRTLVELRQLRARDLKDHVLRLRVEMSVSAPEYEEVERILREMEGDSATHPRVGVLDLHREQLTLDTSDMETLCQDLPEVLQAAVKKLKDCERADPANADVAQRALYHLYQAARRAS